MITQLAIAVLGTVSLALMLTGRTRPGLICALLAQPAWIVTVWQHRQWGVLYIAAVYTGLWAVMLWKEAKK